MTNAGVHVHRAERADALADALARLLAVPSGDPFASEVVAVPARGVERWLAQRLSHRLGAGPDTDAGTAADGVCAGIAFCSPASIVGSALAAASGVDPAEDPWLPGRAVWPLLEVLDAAAGEAWSTPLHAHRARRFALARRLASLFATYAAHRPAMVRDWLLGDGGVEPDLAWQPELWRRLRARIGSPGPAERLPGACAALRADPDLVDLPARLSLFGPTRLAADELGVLAALGCHRAVHLWLPHPSPALWQAVAATSRPGTPVPARAQDRSAGRVAHPLLASLGRDVRELQVRLAEAAPATDRHHDLPDPPPTLLGRLQRDLRDDRAPDATFRPEPGDTSVAVHACHGPDRQVEVLREIVMGLLAADPTLEPRDVLVMCPDIETFAPLISASFGLGERTAGSHPAQALPVRLADRALRQVNPVVDVVARLLELADDRLTSAQVLDLLAAEPVRRRFGLDTDDLDRLRELAAHSGVRWGLDSAHRGPYRLEGFPQNTWSAGLDRLLLGVATAGGSWLGTALPLDEVEPRDAVPLGRLAEFVERLGHVLDALGGERPLAEWSAELTGALDLLTDTAPVDAWQSAQARSELAEAVRAAGVHAVRVPLALADVRALLIDQLRGRPTRANFRTGMLTVATLVPMRSVPHRVVCLLGLDEGTFPRATAVDGDDVLARSPLVGERDVRSEDRQLLLDAVCAATERLVVVHSGADARTGARRPPAVPLGELIDTIAATAPGTQIVTRHPLQPFDARNFTPDRPFSFDRTELRGACAAARPRLAAAPFLAKPLPVVSEPVVLLDDLVTFLEHPVKGFLRQRIGLSVFTADGTATDALPVEPDGLATWAIGDRLLHDRLAGRPLDACRQAEWRRGELPPGALGQALLARVIEDVEPLVAEAAAVTGGPPEPHPAPRTDRDRAMQDDGEPDGDIDVALPGGVRVVGTVGGLHRTRDGAVLLRVEYSRLRPRQRIRAWVRLLALTAATGAPWRAVTIGRGLRFGRTRAEVGPIEPATARTLLADLVALRAEGLCSPLPLATEVGHEYAHRLRRGASPQEALDEALRGWSGGVPERDEDAHVQVWGPAAPPTVLTGRPGPPGGQPTRFGTLAVRLWEPLLAAEELIRR